MASQKIFRGIRLEPMLSNRCDEKAAAKDVTFSEWVRQVLRREVGLTKQANGTKPRK